MDEPEVISNDINGPLCEVCLGSGESTDEDGLLGMCPVCWGSGFNSPNFSDGYDHE